MRPRRLARFKNPLLEVLLFSVGGARYGVELGQVVGVIRDLPEMQDGPDADTGNSILFEGRSVPMFPASDVLHDAGTSARQPREVIVFDDGRGLYGMTVDSADQVVEVSPGDELYTFPPQEVSDVSPCRPWGLLTVAERPVILLDMTSVVVH